MLRLMSEILSSFSLDTKKNKSQNILQIKMCQLIYCLVNGSCKIFICLTTVDFPDSPAPMKEMSCFFLKMFGNKNDIRSNLIVIDDMLLCKFFHRVLNVH